MTLSRGQIGALRRMLGATVAVGALAAVGAPGALANLGLSDETSPLPALPSVSDTLEPVVTTAPVATAATAATVLPTPVAGVVEETEATLEAGVQAATESLPPGDGAETTNKQGNGNSATANVDQSNTVDQSQRSYQRQSLVQECKQLLAT